jgi:hypothetical protein
MWLGIASGLHPFEEYSTHMTGRHWIGCGCLENVAMEFMCGECSEELWHSFRSVKLKMMNHEIILQAVPGKARIDE